MTQGQKLNLKFTVAHTDRMLAMAARVRPAKDIAADIGRLVPCSVEEVRSICDSAGQFVRSKRA